MNLNSALRDSAEIFIANPKFIAPKLVVSFLYGILIIFTAANTIDAITEPSMEVLANLLTILFASFVVVIADIVLSSMYSFMTGDLLAHKKVSLSKAFGKSISAALVTIPAYLAVLIAFGILTAIAELVVLSLVPQSIFFVVVTIVDVIILLAAVFLFYFLFPVIAFEKTGIIKSMKRSVTLSLKSKSEVLPITLISFAISALSFGAGFALEFYPQPEQTIIVLAVFVLLRFLAAYIYAYLYVLNPVVYLKVVKK